MKKYTRMRIKLVAICLLLPVALYAKDAAVSKNAIEEESFRIPTWHEDVLINEDGTEESTITFSIQVLRKDAIEYAKERTISYSSSAEKVEVIKAFTHKADGKEINALANNYQNTVNSGIAGNAPAFSDQTTLTILFPEVEIGDTVTYVYKKTVTKPLFPKQFSEVHHFSKEYIYDDVKIHYSIPIALNALYENFGMRETVNKRKDGRQILEWTFKNTTVEKDKRTWERPKKMSDEPGVIISTFDSYAAIAEAYGARAKTKAVVTKQIQKLADSITKGKESPREQAKALNDWIIDNMTYAGNCIGIGAVVPRDLDFVVQNRMGDCKDHATLYQTLLKAKGIESTQVLIGANSIYELPKVPIVSVANHVINYIPAFDLYVDTTWKRPFGLLPGALAGKPVFWVDGYKDGTKTPTPLPETSKSKVSSTVTIAEDGSAKGTMTVTIFGEDAYKAYKDYQYITSKQLDELNKKMLNRSNYQGTVKFKPGQWDEKQFRYSYEVSFSFKDYIAVETPGALPISPPFAPQHIETAIKEVVQKTDEKMDYDFLCQNGSIEEDYTYILPKNVTILAIPKSLNIESKVQKYSSQYSQSGQTFHIKRTFEDASPAPVCHPDIEKAYAEIAPKVWKDLKAQAVYK